MFFKYNKGGIKMPKKLTQQDFEKRVFDCVGDLYQVISEYRGKSKPVALKCNKHNIQFQVSAECFMRGQKDIRTGGCPRCQEEKKNERYKNSRQEVQCAYCGKYFIKPKSKLENSKSGLYFCCREHKDLAQSLNSGEKFNQIRPNHYGELLTDYRKMAFRNYEHKCAVCDYNEDVDILEVHHIDGNRQNNELDNLIILCPICHRKLTNKKYMLINNNSIIKVN